MGAGASRDDLRHATAGLGAGDTVGLGAQAGTGRQAHRLCPRMRREPVDRRSGCTLEAFELCEGEWALVASAEADERISIRPFAAIKLLSKRRGLTQDYSKVVLMV